MKKIRNSNKAGPNRDSKLLEIEQAYWEDYEDYDWSSDATKEKAIGFIPRLDGDILELCVGGGAFARKIPKCYRSYAGLDLSRTLLKALKEGMPHVTAVHGDAQDLPFDDNSFDTVMLFSGLHHLPKVEESLQGICRVLRSGGCFFCFEPNDRAWYRAPMRFLRGKKAIRDFIKIYSEDEVYLDPDEVSRAMARAGLTDIKTDYITPRFNPEFLGFANRVFARMIYAAAALGSSINTQSYFAMSGRKP